jgi:D-alanine-D-alanine ligase
MPNPGANSMKSKRVGILMGGSSAERELSIRSGRAIAAALAQAGHDVVRIDLGAKRDPIDQIRASAIDCAYLALHGRLGEDGCIQGMLEWLGIPYTGAGVLESALATDKLKSKEMFRLHNVATPPYYLISGKSAPSDILDVHRSFGYPAVVKPRREGSNVGVCYADDEASLVAAVHSAAAYDSDVLVERFVRGKHITVGLLNGRLLGALEVMSESAMLATSGAQASSRNERLAPANLTPALHTNVLLLAERAAEVVGVSGAVCVDLVASEEQNEYVLLVNSMPSMANDSRIRTIAEAAGFGCVELCEAVLSTARLHVQSSACGAVRAKVVSLASPEERALRVVAG